MILSPDHTVTFLLLALWRLEDLVGAPRRTYHLRNDATP